MSRIQLLLESVGDRYAVFRGANPATGIVEERPPVPALRLSANVLVGQDPPVNGRDDRRIEKVILDTGAPLSIFQHVKWSAWPRDTIEWLDLVDGQPAPASRERRPRHLQQDPPANHLVKENKVGGGTYRAWLGRVWLGALDRHRRLPAVRVTSWFVVDPVDPNHKLPPSLLGLHQSILDGRRLLRTFDADDHLSFYQSWFLEL